MPNPQLTSYITAERAKGVPDAQIRQALLTSGWQAPDVDGALSGQVAYTQPQYPQSYAQPQNPVYGQPYAQPYGGAAKKKWGIFRIIKWLFILFVLVMVALGLFYRAMMMRYLNMLGVKDFSAQGIVTRFNELTGGQFAKQINQAAGENLAKPLDESNAMQSGGGIDGALMNIVGGNAKPGGPESRLLDALGGSNTTGTKASVSVRSVTEGETVAYNLISKMVDGIAVSAGDPPFVAEMKAIAEKNLALVKSGRPVPDDDPAYTKANEEFEKYVAEKYAKGDMKCLNISNFMVQIEAGCENSPMAKGAVLGSLRTAPGTISEAIETELEMIKSGSKTGLSGDKTGINTYLGQLGAAINASGAIMTKTAFIGLTGNYLAMKYKPEAAKELKTWGDAYIKNLGDQKTPSGPDFSVNDTAFWNKLTEFANK